MIWIFASNPYVRGNQYVDYLGSLQQWNVNVLKNPDIGQQICIRNGVLVHYVNWRVIPKDLQALPKFADAIRRIRSTWKTDPSTAPTADW
jgi:hypothetical protein